MTITDTTKNIGHYMIKTDQTNHFMFNFCYFMVVLRRWEGELWNLICVITPTELNICRNWLYKYYLPWLWHQQICTCHDHHDYCSPFWHRLRSSPVFKTIAFILYHYLIFYVLFVVFYFFVILLTVYLTMTHFVVPLFEYMYILPLILNVFLKELLIITMVDV